MMGMDELETMFAETGELDKLRALATKNKTGLTTGCAEASAPCVTCNFI